MGMNFHFIMQKNAVLVRRAGTNVLIPWMLWSIFLVFGLLYGRPQAKQSGSHSPSFDVCLVQLSRCDLSSPGAAKRDSAAPCNADKGGRDAQ